MKIFAPCGDSETLGLEENKPVYTSTVPIPVM